MVTFSKHIYFKDNSPTFVTGTEANATSMLRKCEQILWGDLRVEPQKELPNVSEINVTFKKKKIA